MRGLLAAVLVEAGRIEVREIPDPEPGPDEVIVKVKACGICGSDLRYFYGENPWAIHTLGYDKPNPPNMVLGHEVAGEIVEVGAQVSRERIGEKVVLLAYRACGSCYFCLRGKENLCPNTRHIGHSAGWKAGEFDPGGMAEFIPIWADKAYPLPETISFEGATLLDGAGVALRAVSKAGVFPGATVFVIGCGPIGTFIGLISRAYGARWVGASDVYQKALDIAGRLGLDMTLSADSQGIRAAVMDATGGNGADFVFETADTRETQALALDLLAPGSTALFLAGIKGELTLPTKSLAGERSITTSANFRYQDFQAIIDLIATRRVPVGGMVTHSFPLNRVAEAFAVMEEKEKHGALKIVLKP